MSRSSLRSPLALALGLTAALLLTACGDDGGGTTSQAPGSGTGKDAALAAKVPADISSDGKLVVGTDASYAPSEFIDKDGKTVVGFDADLAKALGQVLGLTVELQNAPFDSLVEGVKSGKFELGMSSFTVNTEREAVVDMVSYYTAGTSWAVAAGNPTGLTPDNACGKKVAVQKGTVQVDDITARSKTCTDAGKPSIAIAQYSLQSEATSAVVTGKDDAVLADSPVMAYAVKQTAGKLQLAGDAYDSAPYGIAVPKGLGDYTAAIQGAMQKLIDDGTYLKVLKQWGVEGGAVTKAEVNPV